MSDDRFNRDKDAPPLPSIKRYLTAIPRKQWVSRKAPGTPPGAEVVFEFMATGNTENGAFRFARSNSSISRLTDDQLWQAYETWCEGKVSPFLSIDPLDAVYDAIPEETAKLALRAAAEAAGIFGDPDDV